MQLTTELLQDWKKTTTFFRAVAALAESQAQNYAQLCAQLINVNLPFPAAVYVAAAKVFRALGDEPKYEQAGAAARRSGFALLGRGDLKLAAEFFAEAAEALPETCTVYARLYGMVHELSAAYRSVRLLPVSGGRRRMLISLAVWGDRYVELLTRYFIPSMLSPKNLPDLCQIREVHFDLYTTEKHADAIRRTVSFQRMTEFVQVQVIEFPQELLADPEYDRSVDLRYRMFGGFHHASIERARALEADLMLITPDCVFTDGVVSRYARLVDDGYSAVFSYAIRTQAEGVRPTLDSLRDESTQSLSLSPHAAVELNALNIHHSYKQYFLTKDNDGVPRGPSVFLLPHDHGYYARVLHMHPMLLSADVLKKPVKFDYYTIDSSALAELFPTVAACERIKVIQDSDDGMVMEISHSADHPTGRIVGPTSKFSLDILATESYRLHHFWLVQHRIDFHCPKRLESLGSYRRLADGSLERHMLPVSSRVDVSDEDIGAWFRERTGVG